MIKIKKILDNYNIKYINYYKIFKGYASKKWIIISDNGKKYILKQIDQSIERVNSIMTIQSILKDYSPKILEAKDKKLFVDFEGKHYYLCEYLDCESLNVEQNIKNIGIFLGKLHNEMSQIKNIHTKFLKINDNTDKIKEYLDYHKNHNNKIYVEILEYKLQLLKKISRNNINFELLSEQIIHGDFYIDNILLLKSSYKIVDFDQCCEFFKEYEVLRGIMMICSKLKSRKKKFELMKHFIVGYKSINQIKSSKDAFYLYLYIQANSLSSLKPDDYGIKMKMSFAKKRYNILKFLVDNEAYIIDILDCNGK